MGAVETTRGVEMKRLAIALLLPLLAWRPVRAEVDTVRIAMPYGLVYLPTYVVVDRQLIQKHAAAAGLGAITVTLRNMASGPVTSDMILANDADIGMGGWGPAFIMWDKTSGANKVRGIMPLSSSAIVMLSIDPRIKSLRDFQDGDRIGISAIKVTDQAVTLQMAAAKEWGWDQRFRLDPLTISVSNPDGMAALLSGRTEVKNHYTIVPFSVLEEESGKVHRVMTSDDYVTPGSSGTVMYASARFHDPNPKSVRRRRRGLRGSDRVHWPGSRVRCPDLRRSRAAKARPGLGRAHHRRSETDHLFIDAARHQGACRFHVQARHAEASADLMERIVLGKRLGSRRELITPARWPLHRRRSPAACRIRRCV